MWKLMLFFFECSKLTRSKSKDPVPLHWQMQNVKISCSPLKNAMHPLYTRCVRISYALSIKHPYTVISSAQKSFELHKTFWTDELSTVYDVNLQHIRATNGPCPLSLVERLRFPFCFILASSKLTSVASENGENRKIWYMERLCTLIVART